MNGEGRTRTGSPGPSPTWGSTMIVASGTTSSPTTTSSLPVPPPAMRTLHMAASPEENPRSIDRRMSASSPVEEFSSPIKPNQISQIKPSQVTNMRSHPVGSVEREDGELASGVAQTNTNSDVEETPFVARVGAWEIPNIKEQEAACFEIDPNGDDDQVAEQIESMIAIERGNKRKLQDDEYIMSSMPSQASQVATGSEPPHIPQASTPPSKRQRRGRIEGEPSIVPLENSLLSTALSTANQQRDQSIDFSELPDTQSILADPLSDASRRAIAQYVKASTLIPNFLKDEIVRCVQAKAGQESPSQDTTSGSDTQEDGFLKTKPFWIFELLRLGSDGVIAGHQMTSDVREDESTLILHLYSDALTYGVQLIEREPLLMNRSEARSNPWFDGNGHPFSVVYQKPFSLNSSNEMSTSMMTQASAEQSSHLQSEIEQLSEERRLAISAQEKAEKQWKEALASNQSTQEDNDFLRERYGEASNMAAQLANTNQQLSEEVISLKNRLLEGIKSIRAMSENRIQVLQTKLQVTQSQLNLLKEQNRLTNDAIREKAAKWDAYQAKERMRLAALEKKKAEIDPERAALYQAIQEDELKRALEYRKAPHEHFLEVDLAEQKETLRGFEREEDDDELKMLRAEAEEATGREVNFDAPRSSRRSRTVPQISADDYSSVAQVIAQSQEQAQLEVADVLQGELDHLLAEGDQDHRSFTGQ